MSKLRYNLDKELFDDTDCWQDALPGRKELANALTKLLAMQKDGVVLALNAPWGFGKTTFIRRWKHDAKIQTPNQVFIYFNAWENDHQSDPLIALISHFRSEFKEWKIRASPDKDADRAIEKILQSVGSLTRKALPLAVSYATKGLVQAIDLPIGEAEVRKSTEDLAKKALQDYEEARNGLQKFRTELEECVDSVTEASEGRPIIFVVDELDRCRPSFAIAMLERIKHLFSVRGIAFVLVIDRRQLSHAICGVYGQGFDGNSYLNRFIDFDYQLPSVSSLDYFEFRYKSMEIEGICKQIALDDSFLKPVLGMLIASFQLSLRDIDQVLVRLLLTFRASPVRERVFLTTIAPLLLCARQRGLTRLIDDLFNRTYFVNPELPLPSVTDPIENWLGTYMPGSMKSMVVHEGYGYLIGALVLFACNRNQIELALNSINHASNTYFNTNFEQRYSAARAVSGSWSSHRSNRDEFRTEFRQLIDLASGLERVI